MGLEVRMRRRVDLQVEVERTIQEQKAMQKGT
jgi:hypothetical protein